MPHQGCRASAAMLSIQVLWSCPWFCERCMVGHCRPTAKHVFRPMRSSTTHLSLKFFRVAIYVSELMVVHCDWYPQVEALLNKEKDRIHNFSCRRHRFECLFLGRVRMVPFEWLPLCFWFKMVQLRIFHLPSQFSQENHHHSHTMPRVQCTPFFGFLSGHLSTPRNPPCTKFSQPQLFQYSAHTWFLNIQVDWHFFYSQTFVLQNHIADTLYIVRCYAVCGLLVRKEFRILACPLTNCTAIYSVIFIHIFQSLMNVSHCLILTKQELCKSTLLLTNIKRSSHFDGVLWQCYAWERFELNLNTGRKHPSMRHTNSKTIK
jgi:hypothetical protein